MKMFYSKCLSAKWTNMHKKVRLLLLGASVFAGGLTQLHAQVPATCTPSYSTGCTSNDDIRDVILIGNSVTLSNLNTPCPSGGYQDYTGSATLGIPDLFPGQTYSGNVTTNYTGLSEHVKIWIDFDEDGIFSTTEEVAAFGPINNTSPGNFSVSIPTGTTPGVKRMRVVLNYSTSPSGPCGSFTWGETHDYAVQVMSVVPCTNPPVAGTAVASPSGQVCIGVPVTLNLNGVSLNLGQTYEWESSTNGVTYTSMGPATTSPVRTVSPSVSTWYRCKVVCSGGTPQYSTPVQVTMAAGMSGTYTVNSAAPTGGTNFNNFTALANALNCGISGPVVVNVVPGSGPYTDTFHLMNIGGASPTTRVRINGNGETIQFNPTSTSNNKIVTLEGTKYLTIDSLKIKTTNATYGWGIFITGDASRDSIINCEIDLSTITGTSSANANGIVISGSPSSATTSSNVSHLYIGNNRVIGGSTGSGGGYYGITFSGVSSTNQNDSIFIVGNEVTNFYYYGIRCTYVNGGEVSYNDIHRSNQTAISTTAYGIYYYYGVGVKCVGNRVHNMASTGVSSTSTFYGIYNYHYNNTAATPVLIANNAVYNLGNYSGTQYLMYNYGPAQNVYHNTIDVSAVQGTSTSTIYCMYNGYNQGSNYKNNIIKLTGGNNGTKYGMYHVSTTYSASYQKNNVYFASTQSGTQTPYYYGTSYASLAAFQAAYPTQEIGSPSVDPQFSNAAAGDLTPSNSNVIFVGENVMSLVPQDINGLPRGITPTLGAFEKVPTNNNDAAVAQLISPSGYVCAGTIPVQAEIRNAGINNLTSVQVNWSVNGVTQTPYTFTGTLVPLTATTGQNTAVVNLGNATLNNGNNTIVVWTTSPNGVADPDTSNDTLTSTFATTNFSVATAASEMCISGSNVAMLTPNSGYQPGQITWESSTNGTTWNAIPNSDVTTLTVSNLTGNTYLRAKITNNTMVCYSALDTIEVINPAIITTAPAGRCDPGTLTLGATAAPGTIISWYDGPTATTPLATGGSFTTPPLTTTTTYYVGAATGGGADSIAVPLSSGSTTGVYHNMFLVESTTGVTVNEIALKVNNAIGTLTDWEIYYRPDNYQLVTGANTSAAGWILLASTTNVPSAGTGDYTTIAQNLNLDIPAGATYSIYIAPVNGTHQYATNAAGTVTASTATMEIRAGHRGSALFNCSTSGGQAVVKLRTSSECAGQRVPVVAAINTPPTVNLGPDTLVCTPSYTLDAGNAGANYVWSNNSTNQTLNVTTSGQYYVTVTDANNCSASDTVNVTVVPPPAVNLGNDTAICQGASVTLNAGNPGANIQWENNSNAQTRTVSNPGQYHVTVSYNANCKASDTINIIVNPLPVVDLGPDTSLCGSGSVIVLDAGNPGASYYWDNGATTQTRTVSTLGNYSVIVTDTNNCSAADTINIDQIPNPTGTFTTQEGPNGSVNFTAIASNSLSYDWDFGDGTQGSGNPKSHQYAANGTYTVTLSLVNECGVTSDIVRQITITNVPVGINELVDDKNIHLFPNPANDRVTISNEGARMIQSVVLTDALGRQLQTVINEAKASELSLELNGLSSGWYNVIIYTESGKVVRKLNVLK